MSDESKRNLIKAALLAATSGVAEEDVKENRAELRVATGIRAGVESVTSPYLMMFVKDPGGPGNFKKALPK
jgi:hypothetical protein